MLYILFTVIFIVGTFVHLIVTRLPIFLYRSWTQECINYLKEKQVYKAEKIKWQSYFPFFSIRLLALDSILFVSSIFIFYHFDSYLYWITALFFTWLLIISSTIDFEHQILPDELSYSLLWAGLVCSCWGLYTNSMNAILGALLAYFSLWIISFLFKLIRKKEGLGQGDLKLFAAIATWTGILYLPLILFLAALSSIIFIFFRKIIAKKSYSDPAPFGPFLAFSGWLVLLWGSEIAHFLIY